MQQHKDDSVPIVGKKRIRATQACTPCRKKKIRCDGAKPECMHCQESSITCEYSECRKRGPRRGYVQLLEERIAQLERRLASDEKNSTSSNDSAQPRLPMPHSSGKSSGPDGKAPHAKTQPEDNRDCDPPMDIVIHLIDLFFKHLNSVFPLLHRKTLKRSLHDGTVSRPLLWAIMAIGARFSNHPLIKIDPPYWAGERFAVKAASLVDVAMLEPTIPNLQFWGIMACLEYGRASGSRAWMYTGLAVRICHELALNKEATLSKPIMRKDGTVDTAAMALRRRIFWSCFSLDKFASAGTGRPQYFDASDCDATMPTVEESVLLLDHFQCTNINDEQVTNDSLMDIARHYLDLVVLFGQVNKLTARMKSDAAHATWPPSDEFVVLDHRLRQWKVKLPARFQFNPENLSTHKENASKNYLTIWLTSHAVWCTTMLVMHRGSLAYDDRRRQQQQQQQCGDSPLHVHEAVQSSIDTCKTCIDEAMSLFAALRDLCGRNVWPYMGYSAYICATVLMTSTFSHSAESYARSRQGLRVLYEMIEGLRPYWAMCERLALTTKDLLFTHTKLYSSQYNKHTTDDNLCPLAAATPTRAVATTATDQITHAPLIQHASSQNTASTSDGIHQHWQSTTEPDFPIAQLQQSAWPLLYETLNTNVGEINFNSSNFLYDSALFGQIMFDNTLRPATDSTLPNVSPPFVPVFSSQQVPASLFSDVIQERAASNDPVPTASTSSPALSSTNAGMNQ